MPAAEPPSSARLLSLWQANADAWADAVRGGAIESRRVCTDAAVVAAVLRHRPARVLDVGCGEGWLTRALAARGLFVRGVDPVQRLVDSARAASAGSSCASPSEFAVAGIADLLQASEAGGFDLWVCNFSLFHADDASTLAAAARRHLKPGGWLVVQTLHAAATGHVEAAIDGWQPGSWGACGDGFGEAIPWYFRSLSSWRQLLGEQGFDPVEIDQPAHPATAAPLSMLIAARSPR